MLTTGTVKKAALAEWAIGNWQLAIGRVKQRTTEQRENGTMRQWDKGTIGPRDNGPRDKGTKGQRKLKLSRIKL